MSEPAVYTDAKDIPAWRQLIVNGEIVADKADTTRVSRRRMG